MERKAKQVCVSRVSSPIVGSNVTIIIIIIMSSSSTGDSAGGRKGRKGRKDKDVQAVNLEGERESQL